MAEARLNYGEFQKIPRYDSRRFELIEGKVFIPPTPNTAHQRTVGNVHFALDKFVRQRGVGEVFLGPLILTKPAQDCQERRSLRERQRRDFKPEQEPRLFSS
jgi:hypothetical protein